jgi:two-component system LytT family sensor kinase
LLQHGDQEEQKFYWHNVIDKDMSAHHNQLREKKGIRYFYTSWLKANLYNLALGVVIGLLLTLLISAFNGQWIGWRKTFFQLLYSTVISVCITNVIYIPQRYLRFRKENVWLFLIVYYVSGMMGMIIAIELIYLIQAWLFHDTYHFFHWEDVRFSSVIVVIICTIIYAYLSQKRMLNAKIQERDLDLMRLSQMKTQAELATLQSKINPHFLYNSLNGIASLIHQNPDKAERMTLQLSKLFRYSINQNQDHLVTVKEEMEIVTTYLEIEKIRFEERIDFKVAVDEALNLTKIPRFLIQPLVENALKHGLKDMTEKAELVVEISKTDRILISIADNGVPFPDELEIGYGLQSTYDKLKLLYGDHYEVQITNHPNKKITILIPLNHG